MSVKFTWLIMNSPVYEILLFNVRLRPFVINPDVSDCASE